MEITFSKRKLLLTLLALMALVTIGLATLKRSGHSLAQVTRFDSGREAAISGAQAFYSVDYHAGADQWAAHLCHVSTQPACTYYQNTVAPFLWPTFIQNQTIVNAEANQPVLLSEGKTGDDETDMQIWRLAVTLSAPWPQGDGETEFPVHVLVVREANGWKFERFLLSDEISNYSGGKK